MRSGFEMTSGVVEDVSRIKQIFFLNFIEDATKFIGSLV